MTGTEQLVAILGAAIIASLGTLLAARQANGAAKDREVRDAGRRLDDAKRGRLRGDYAVLLAQGQAWLQATYESNFVLSTETIEQRDERLGVLLGEAAKPGYLARIHLALEAEAKDVINAFDSAKKAWIAWRIAQGLPSGKERAGKLTETAEMLGRSVAALEDIARKHLEEIDARIAT